MNSGEGTSERTILTSPSGVIAGSRSLDAVCSRDQVVTVTLLMKAREPRGRSKAGAAYRDALVCSSSAARRGLIAQFPAPLKTGVAPARFGCGPVGAARAVPRAPKDGGSPRSPPPVRLFGCGPVGAARAVPRAPKDGASPRSPRPSFVGCGPGGAGRAVPRAPESPGSSGVPG